MAKEIWSLKYRPKQLDDYIFQNEKDETVIRKFLEEGYIPHCLFYGHRGTGKSSLAYLIQNVLGIDDMDMLTINASDENSVDTIRHKVKTFITTMSMGEFKLVFLDEFDAMSLNAQEALKSMMEEHADNARFIFACNKPHKIIPEIKSRCHEFAFKSLDKTSMLEKVYSILQKEEVKVTNVEQLDGYVDISYPDMRKLINLVQKNTIDGVLADPNEDDAIENGESFVALLSMVEKNNVMKDRDFIYENLTDDECMDAYKQFIEYLTEIFKTTTGQKKAVVTIADHIHRDYFSAVKQATLESCLVQLSNIYKEEKNG